MYRYRVLLVDDEPLVLAGIKIMADWESLNCELVGLARNGKEAAELMKELRPDIVVADINMPVMNGIELLKATKTMHSEMVFIILTNMQEFDLLRECLHYQVIDYLIKTEMDSSSLETAIRKAKGEVDKKRKLSVNALERDFEQLNVSKVISEGMVRMFSTSYLPDSVMDLLERQGMLESYLFIAIQFSYWEPLLFSESAYQEYDRLYLWEREIIETVSKTCFRHVQMIRSDLQDSQETFLLVWGSQLSDYEPMVQQFHKKLCVASSELTRLKPCILTTEVLSGREELSRWPGQIQLLQNYVYNCEEQLVYYAKIPEISFTKLDVHSWIRNMRRDMENQHGEEVLLQLEAVIHMVEQEGYKRYDVVDLCGEIYRMIGEMIGEDWTDYEGNGLFSEKKLGYAYLKYILTRKDALHFLKAMGNEMSAILQPVSSHHDDIVRQVKLYIRKNIDKRFSLNELAQHVYLSPGYLSALFKKNGQESLVDYINRKKMEKAGELLESEKYLINQVSEMLSFENSYYFTRVFKKHMGVTPKEYQERARKKRKG